MSNEWEIKTGTIYFHLKELNSVIDQDETKAYILNKKGEKLCRWFIQTDEGKVEVVKLDSFSYMSNLFGSKISDSPRVFAVLLALSIIGLILASFQDILVIGTFLLPKPNFIEHTYLYYYNLVLFLVIMGFYLLSLILVNQKQIRLSMNYFIIFLLGQGAIFVFLILLFVLSLVIPISLPLVSWVVISIISQILFLSIVSSYLISRYGINITRSIIISFLVLYITLILAVVFS